MTSNMQPLRDEHAEMRMFVEALLIAADVSATKTSRSSCAGSTGLSISFSII
ncbi:MAG: hypothetical protein ACXVQ7_05415 [Actinomycetota bacterium]